MHPNISYTFHALNRQAQRNLSPDDVRFVLRHGRRVHNAGALHVFLARRDIPTNKMLAQRYGRLEGTTLVLHCVNGGWTLITAYRNRRGLKAVRQKTKYDRRVTSWC